MPYDLPADIGHQIFDAAQKVAIAMKQAYSCIIDSDERIDSEVEAAE